ncbi:MAG: SDR family NAD(P)-dependent oxidoreductase [Planctomycetes bacterium]|nr:SDR family NAD(P)-dependent oxidoreductase [Planctomycetota bacterium]NOG55668.1 SDR family NAD(P)-dependent oxidoreductase [Planctomycetota bacterium]
MQTPTHKHALITGGTGALGRAVVSRFLEHDYHCHVTWADKRELTDLPFADDDRITLHELDVTDESSVVEYYADRVANEAYLRASIHIVGGFAMAPVTETTAADFERMWRLNTLSCFLCCREAVRRFRGQPSDESDAVCGRIVNVAARPAVAPVGGMVAYSASKAAVASITQSLAEEVKADPILVNAIVPSIMDTPANRAAMPDADHDAWPKVADVARAIYHLASPDNVLTSGALVPVYGRC